MVTDTVEGARRGRFADLLSELGGSVRATAATAEDVAGAVAALESGAAADTRILVDEATAKETRDSFLLSARVADLVDDDGLSVRVADPEPSFTTLLVGEDVVYGLTSIGGDAVTELRADEATTTVETVREAFEDCWADAEQFSVRTPPYSGMLGALAERLDESMRADVERVFEAAAGPHDGAATVEPVRLSLLMGAKNEVQFYELGRWGESAGVASRAKFSREKQVLEEQGLIDTEKIPTDVGRPRQRLVLPDRLEEKDPLELLDTARSVLAE